MFYREVGGGHSSSEPSVALHSCHSHQQTLLADARTSRTEDEKETSLLLLGCDYKST